MFLIGEKSLTGRNLGCDSFEIIFLNDTFPQNTSVLTNLHFLLELSS